MLIYKITITKIAQKQLDKLNDHLANRLIDAIYELATTPDLWDTKS